MNNLVYIVIDSARYDAYTSACTPNMDRVGKVERRFSYASWTSPSHLVYLMGMTPHSSPAGVFASEVYKEDFKKWTTRLGIADLSFKNFVPTLALPYILKQYGYLCHALVSMPVLNEYTVLATHFDTYKLMPNHNDFDGIIEKVEMSSDHPSFYFLNLGEAHYPYMLKGEKDVPIIHGVHGVFKHLDDLVAHPETKTSTAFFTAEQLKKFKAKQIACIEHIDRLMEKLLHKCPNTYFIITSDHGELFGEEGYFGHGPIFHAKVFEVPFLEGMVS